MKHNDTVIDMIREQLLEMANSSKLGVKRQGTAYEAAEIIAQLKRERDEAREKTGKILIAPAEHNEWDRFWRTEVYFGSEAERDEFDRKLVEGWAPLEWISTEAEVPADDEMVLCVVTGKHGNIDFRNAIQLGNWYEGEGWVLDTYPEIEKPNVTHWMELPEGPGEE